MEESKLRKLCLVLAALFITTVLFAACTSAGKVSDDPTISESESQQKDTSNTDTEKDLEGILDYIDEITEEFIEEMENAYDENTKAVGDSYETYKSNYHLISDWYASLNEKTDEIYEIIREQYRSYFQQAWEIENIDEDTLDDALEDAFDQIYTGAYDDIFDDIYAGILDDCYDDYYCDLLDDAYDSVKYEEWSEARNSFWEEWSGEREIIYEKWSGERAFFYTVYSALRSDLHSRNYDFDEHWANAEAEYKIAAEEQKKEKERREAEVDVSIEYKIEDNKAIITGYNGEGNHVTIASEYGGCEVTAIGESAFEDFKELQSVLCWADIETIGDNAFKNCSSLIEISIPSSTTVIGAHAFENCEALEDLIIWGDPDIGDYAFAHCKSLKTIDIGSDTQKIGAHAYEGCTGAEDLVLWGIKEIGEYAFAGCTGIKEVSVPSEAEIIRTHAFDGCTSLETVIVWGKNTKVEIGAFDNCPKLKDRPAEVEISETNQENQSDTELSGIRPEFQQAMDEYVAFFEEYCKFMKTFEESSEPFELFEEYMEYMEQYETTMDAFDEMGDEDMSPEEMELYAKTQMKIELMLMEALQ